MNIIYETKAKCAIKENVRKFENIITRAKEKNGADVILLGCTELPLLTEELKVSNRFINPIEIAINKLCYLLSI